MVTKLRVTIRGKNYDIAAGSKADVARALFEAHEGFSVSEVSKAIPMAYSQAHSIAKKLQDGLEGRTYEYPGNLERQHREMHKASRDPASDTEGEVYRHDNNARRRATARAIVGSRREPDEVVPAGAARHARNVTPGPAPKAVTWKGVCANCGHDIEARMVGRQNTFVHVHVTPEEFLKTIQFCMAFPRGMA